MRDFQLMSAKFVIRVEKIDQKNARFILERIVTGSATNRNSTYRNSITKTENLVSTDFLLIRRFEE